MARREQLKRTLARACRSTGVSRLGLAAQRRARMPFARALNYHDVPASEADAFEAQLRFYSRHFQSLDLPGLLALASGEWPHERPGLMICLDDGLASHAEVVAPLLEAYGFTGWFMVPTGFVDTPPEAQQAWAAEHAITLRGEPAADGRIAMTWDQVRALSERHVIGCHTVDHVRFSARCTPAQLERETQSGRQRLEEQLGGPVEVFAWVGGEEWAYSRAGAEMIRKAGFRVGLMTNNALFRPGDDLLGVQRVNVESHYEPALMELHLSGLYDLLYRPKRRRVAAAIAAS